MLSRACCERFFDDRISIYFFRHSLALSPFGVAPLAALEKNAETAVVMFRQLHIIIFVY